MRWFRLENWSLLVAVLLCAITGTVKAQRGDVASHLQLRHNEAVRQWLDRSKLSFRLATLADCSNKAGLAITREQQGEGYHPYYTVGDFNGDRKEDFAVALVNPRKRTGRFAVAIFNGPVSKQSVPAYFAQNWDLSDGGLFDSGGGVMAGPFESDNCVILSPRGKKYVIKDCLEG